MATTTETYRILWVDDEIDALTSHIRFLEQKGMSVLGVMSGDDALDAIQREVFDLVLLDEMMPGKDGLTTLEEMKELQPHLPVVMVTKSEEESLMEQAIGQKIDDYVVKPVVPSQILSVIKRRLQSKKIIGSSSMQRYVTELNRFNQRLFGPVEMADWYEAARLVAQWNLDLDDSNDAGLIETHETTQKTWNGEFTKFVTSQYPKWLSGRNRPVMSPDVVAEYVVPPLKQKKSVLFLVIDCMRLDQWMLIEPLLAEFFQIERSYYCSILPTATPFARNAIFAGLWPDEIHDAYPDNYAELNEGSLNRMEDRLLQDNLSRHGVRLDRPVKYEKIFSNREGDELAKRIADYYEQPMTAFVFNFLDILAHGRSTNVILKEIAGTDAAFRALMKTWFTHSPLFRILKSYAQRDVTVVVTSDHGAILCRRGTMAHGRKSTSTNLRYKYGDNLKGDKDDAILVKKPGAWRLPMFSLATTYLIAKEDFYFVYPNNYNEMVRQFQNSFQHGGISLEEMIVPVAVLRGK